MENKYDLGVIIARMQTPYLHAGHLTLIGTALQECDKVMILLGIRISEEIDDRNPYSYPQRVSMIERVFPQVIIRSIFDHKSDIIWSEEVDKTITINYPHLDSEIRLYHSRDSFKDSYSGKYQLIEIPEIPGYSATKIREELNK